MARTPLPSRFLLLLCITLALVPGRTAAQTIVQSRGVDSRVDYTSLVRFGAWDDRNYQLTVEDLALLAPNEEDLPDSIPAFFRVEMRRNWPGLRRSGRFQYPRSALQIFFQRFGGFLVDGTLYRKVEREQGRYRLLLEGGVDLALWRSAKVSALVGESRVTSPNGAAESAVAIHPLDPNRVIAGSNGPGFDQVMHVSTDGGATWSPAAGLPLGNTCCDPTVDWSSDGTFAYTATLGNCGVDGCAVWFYRSADGGLTWDDLANAPGAGGDPRREITTGGSDKEYLHVDHSPTSPHRDHLYLTWHDNGVMKLSRSTDFGNTWSPPLAFSSMVGQLGIGSDITTDAAGNVYYLWPATDSQKIWVRKSTDGGVSFADPVEVAATEASFIFPVPSMETREVFVYTSADSDRSGGPFHGSVYVAYTDSTAPTTGNPAGNHARIQVAWSRDGGAGWSHATPHPTADAEQVDRWHPWLAVAQTDGSVHVIFYDTSRDPTRTSVDVFHAASTDGGQSWSVPVRVTGEQSPNIADGFEFGDYNGLSVVMEDLIAVYTDNRAEAGGGGDSVDIYAGGKTLETTLIFADGFESGNTSAWTGMLGLR